MSPRLLILLSLLVTGAAGAAMDVPERSTSASKQFIVYSDNPSTRSKVSMKAEDFKEFLLQTVAAEDDWKWTVIINIGVQPPAVRNPPPSKLDIYEGDAGAMKVQIDVYDPKYVSQPAFDADLMNAILIEVAYRSSGLSAGRKFELPPAWVTYGLVERIRARDEDLPASLYAGLLSTGRAPDIRDFFRTRPISLDSTSRAIYRAQAAAMLDAVLAEPGGREAMRTYLASPHRYPGEAADLRELLPSLGKDDDMLERKWVLAMARASASNRVNLLSIGETRKELGQILDIKPLPDPKRPEVAAMSGPYALETIARSQSGKFILTQMSDSLLRLSIRAHPLYKPLVDEYYRIVNDLITKPKRRVDKRVALAEEMRAGLSSQTGEVKDYMDWVETTKIQTENDSLSAAVEEVTTFEEQQPRGDAITRYLDAVEDRGW